MSPTTKPVDDGLLKASAPVVVLGKRVFGFEHREWQGKPQLSISEVSPMMDPSNPTQVTAWKPVFKGTRIQGPPDEVHRFLEECLKLTKPGK